MRTEVILVRHAASVVPTADGPDELHRPLTAVGLRQAAELAEVLVAMQPASVWSSPYLRAVQTVEPAARLLDLEVQTHWELREWDHGFGFTRDWMPHYVQSLADLTFTRPDGESLQQLTNRAVDGVLTLVKQYPGKLVLLGSHGTFVSRALAGFGVAVNLPFSRDMPMPALYRLSFDGTAPMPTVTGPGLPSGDGPQ